MRPPVPEARFKSETAGREGIAVFASGGRKADVF
jgi:hypothetical protein